MPSRRGRPGDGPRTGFGPPGRRRSRPHRDGGGSVLIGQIQIPPLHQGPHLAIRDRPAVHPQPAIGRDVLEPSGTEDLSARSMARAMSSADSITVVFTSTTPSPMPMAGLISLITASSSGPRRRQFEQHVIHVEHIDEVDELVVAPASGSPARRSFRNTGAGPISAARRRRRGSGLRRPRRVARRAGEHFLVDLNHSASMSRICPASTSARTLTSSSREWYCRSTSTRASM